MTYASYNRLPARHADRQPFAVPARQAAPRAAAAIAGARLTLRGLARLIRAWRISARERSAAAVLYGLPDHTLRDIGVHRSEIRHIARAVAENPEADHRNLRR